MCICTLRCRRSYAYVQFLLPAWTANLWSRAVENGRIRMRANQFSDLTAFVAVAEHRNFTRAANRLGLSAPTLSHNVRSLEDRLRVRLLNRTTRSVALTAAGERLLAHIQPL